MASIDRMDWHYGSENFPAGLSNENGGTHIGMYLAWIIKNGMIGEIHREEAQEEIQMVLTQEWTGKKFLISVCDEKFWEEDLNELGNKFTAAYYTENGYHADYESSLLTGLNDLYEVEDSWENYMKLEPIINQRYAEWKVGASFN